MHPAIVLALIPTQRAGDRGDRDEAGAPGDVDGTVPPAADREGKRASLQRGSRGQA